MKRLFIFDEHNSSKQNGIGTYIHNLTLALKDEDFEICVLSFNDNVTTFQKEVNGDITYMRFPTYCDGAFLANHEPGLTILRLELTDNPDNIFIVNHFLCNSLLEGLRQYFPESKIVFVVHDQTWTNPLKGDCKLLQSIVSGQINHNAVKQRFTLEQNMYLLAHHVICMNEDTRWLLEHVYNIDKKRIHLIPNGLELCPCKYSDKQKVRERLYIPHSDKVIIYAGRTTKNKGIDDLLVAFNTVIKHIPEARLIVLGEIYRHSEFAQLCQDSISRITFTGLVPTERLRQWYAIADLGIIPSYYEQCGYTGIEFMAAKVPVVASDALGVRCMFKDGVTGLTAHIGDRQTPSEYRKALAAAIINTLKASSTDKLHIIESAYNLYLSHYSLAQMKQRYIKLLKSI